MQTSEFEDDDFEYDDDNMSMVRISFIPDQIYLCFSYYKQLILAPLLFF